MFRLFQKSLKTGVVTTGYPFEKEEAPALFRGRLEFDGGRCDGCEACVAVCPAGAIHVSRGWWQVAYAGCVFCGRCREACAKGAIRLTGAYELAGRKKVSMVVSGQIGAPTISSQQVNSQQVDPSTEILNQKIKRILGRSLHIRHVDAGSCNGCDWEATALLNPVYDLQRLGIDFVASPRHADMLLVTGPVARHMETAVLRTYEATPDPKLVVAAGACACGGGVFGGSYAVAGGVDKLLPVDVYIPGCPPRPQALIYGLLKALDRI
ncbi:MAG: NADH-quinone oxidoreductase subunit NuoB [Syntrophothermus sp.]